MLKKIRYTLKMFSVACECVNRKIQYLMLSPKTVKRSYSNKGTGQLSLENLQIFSIRKNRHLTARSVIDRFKVIDFNYNSE